MTQQNLVAGVAKSDKIKPKMAGFLTLFSLNYIKLKWIIAKSAKITLIKFDLASEKGVVLLKMFKEDFSKLFAEGLEPKSISTSITYG